MGVRELAIYGCIRARGKGQLLYWILDNTVRDSGEVCNVQHAAVCGPHGRLITYLLLNLGYMFGLWVYSNDTKSIDYSRDRFLFSGVDPKG